MSSLHKVQPQILINNGFASSSLPILSSAIRIILFFVTCPPALFYKFVMASKCINTAEKGVKSCEIKSAAFVPTHTSKVTLVLMSPEIRQKNWDRYALVIGLTIAPSPSFIFQPKASRSRPSSLERRRELHQLPWLGKHLGAQGLRHIIQPPLDNYHTTNHSFKIREDYIISTTWSTTIPSLASF